jgi:uncharacterized membrane protein YhdT
MLKINIYKIIFILLPIHHIKSCHLMLKIIFQLYLKISMKHM